MTINEESEIWPNYPQLAKLMTQGQEAKFHGKTNLKGQNMANKAKRKSSSQRVFEKAKFELFGRESGQIATLYVNTTDH